MEGRSIRRICSQVPLNKLDALGMEVAVIAGSTSADEEMRMRLTTIASSIEQVGVGQTKGVDVSRELCTVRCWHVVLFCQMPRYPDAAWLQRIFATTADQSRFRAV
jgi:hypothetical protein